MPAYLPLRLHRRDATSSETAAEPAQPRDDGALVGDLARQRPAPPAPATSPARAALASAIASVTSASAALERAQQPVSRLTSLIAKHDSLTRRLADLRRRGTFDRVADSGLGRSETRAGAGDRRGRDQIAAKKALESLQPDIARAVDRGSFRGLTTPSGRLRRGFGGLSRVHYRPLPAGWRQHSRSSAS
jgi:hypothetical protein